MDFFLLDQCVACNLTTKNVKFYTLNLDLDKNTFWDKYVSSVFLCYRPSLKNQNYIAYLQIRKLKIKVYFFIIFS